MSSLHCEFTFKLLHLSQHVHQSSVPLFVSVDLNQVITLTKQNRLQEKVTDKRRSEFVPAD